MNVPEDKVIVNLDGNQTYRILENIFSNIYKYAHDNTRVYIDLENTKGAKLVIKNISKYALNISAEDLMERFIRGGEESRNTEGSGLGLSIARQLTDIQGGYFNIKILGDVFVVEIEFRGKDEE